MAKKALAVLSMPIILLIGFSAIHGVLTSLQRMGEGSTGYQVGYSIGVIGGCGSLLLGLFFWARWAVRALGK